MLFRVTHQTDYRYTNPVAEAYLELRLTPLNRRNQVVQEHQLAISPAVKISRYDDYFGNDVAFISLPFRHSRLSIASRAIISSASQSLPEESLELSIQEARQLLTGALPFVFDYLQPTEMVKTGRVAAQWARRYFQGSRSLRSGLEGLTRGVYEYFRYQPGSTTFSTDLALIWKQRQGVCQDFAHIMLSILRTAGLPARYVCGYIETEPPANGSGLLIGSAATHAWVEVLVPGQVWLALDPTNNCWCDEQHLAISFGRDARDAAPIRGTFKGVVRQNMRVRVDVKRLKQKLQKRVSRPNAGTN